MNVYCYRSGQIGFALREIPSGAIAIAKGPHPITEEAVHGCARLAHDNETWLVPGIPEATNEEAAYQAMLAFERRLKDRITELKFRRRCAKRGLQPYAARFIDSVMAKPRVRLFRSAGVRA